MATSILSLAQQAMPEMNLATPTSIFGSGIQDNLTVAALFNAAGNELAREYDWNELITELRFNTVYYTFTGTTTLGSPVISALSPAASSLSISIPTSCFTCVGTGVPNDTTIASINSGANTITLSQPSTAANGTYTFNFCQTQYTIATDYDRQINRTQWDKTKRWEMLGPESQQQAQWLKSGYISTGPRLRWWMEAGYFNVWPPMTTNEYLGLVYITKNWAKSASGSGQSAFVADTDTCVFPDRLMVLAVKKKYFQLKGFDSAAFERDYNMHLSIAKAANVGASNLSLAPANSQVLISIAQVPDSSYGS